MRWVIKVNETEEILDSLVASHSVTLEEALEIIGAEIFPENEDENVFFYDDWYFYDDLYLEEEDTPEPSKKTIWTDKDETRGILMTEDGTILKSFGFHNVLGCDGYALMETEELTQVNHDTDPRSFDWTDGVKMTAYIRAAGGEDFVLEVTTEEEDKEYFEATGETIFECWEEYHRHCACDIYSEEF